MEQKEIDEKAEQLSKERNRKVLPIVVTIEDNEKVIGFIEEPKRQMKFAALDEVIKGYLTQAGMMILDGCLIKEHSDSRLYSDSSEHDGIVMGAAIACGELVNMYSAEVKKK